MNLLSELLHSRVVDVDGHSLGSVHDVRLVQDGPFVEGFGASLRIDGLVSGPGGLSIRLGYHRHRVRGPVLLKVLFGALEGRAYFIPWHEIAEWDGSQVRLRCRAAEVPRVKDVD
jgi:hypothetical protein